MYFTKLASNFFIDYQESLDKGEFVNFGSVVDSKFRGIRYMRIVEEYSETLLNFFPSDLRTHFSPGLMKINTPFITPHTDSNICATINFYVSTADAITVFYKFKNDNPEKVKLKNQTSGSTFQMSDLLPVNSFQAKPGDVWLLDVTQPHAVFSKTSENRIAFCLHSNDLSYQEIKEIMRG